MNAISGSDATPPKSSAEKSPPSGSQDADEWNRHEHTSEQVQLEAERLVQLVGSTELAIHAINVVEHRQQELGCESNPLGAPTSDRNDFLLKSLSAFESSIATPVVSGELTEWATIALRSCEELVSLIRDELQHHHAEIFARILRQDVDLSSQIERLRAVDEQLVRVQCNEVTADLEMLLSMARNAKQDEGKLAISLENTIKRAMEFVIAVRTQETIIVTWYNEAFHRDLGPGNSC